MMNMSNRKTILIYFGLVTLLLLALVAVCVVADDEKAKIVSLEESSTSIESSKEENNQSNKNDDDDDAGGVGPRRKRQSEKRIKKRIENAVIIGKYKMTSSSDPGVVGGDYDLYLKAMEYDDEKRSTLRNIQNQTIKISKIDATQWRIDWRTSKNSSTFTLVFKNGVKFLHDLSDGRLKPTMITVDEKAHDMKWVVGGLGGILTPFNATLDWKFNKDGLNITFVAREAEAVLEYGRVDASFEQSFVLFADAFRSDIGGKIKKNNKGKKKVVEVEKKED